MGSVSFGRQDLVSLWPARYKMALDPGKASFFQDTAYICIQFRWEPLFHPKFYLSEVIFKLR